MTFWFLFMREGIKTSSQLVSYSIYSYYKCIEWRKTILFEILEQLACKNLVQELIIKRCITIILFKYNFKNDKSTDNMNCIVISWFGKHGLCMISSSPFEFLYRRLLSRVCYFRDVAGYHHSLKTSISEITIIGTLEINCEILIR